MSPHSGSHRFYHGSVRLYLPSHVDYVPAADMVKKFPERGFGPLEVLVDASVLTHARLRALYLPGRVNTIHDFTHVCYSDPEMHGRELIVLHRGVVIVVPTVSDDFRDALETYKREGWPGIRLQAEQFSSLADVAKELELPYPRQSDEEKARILRNKVLV